MPRGSWIWTKHGQNLGYLQRQTLKGTLLVRNSEQSLNTAPIFLRKPNMPPPTKAKVGERLYFSKKSHFQSHINHYGRPQHNRPVIMALSSLCLYISLSSLSSHTPFSLALSNHYPPQPLITCYYLVGHIIDSWAVGKRAVV